MHHRHRITRSLLVTLLFCLLAVSLLPVAAATKPYLTVSPVWRPGQTMDGENSNGGGFPSDDNDDIYEPGSDDDDVRYVDVELLVSGNVQFWAADVSCTATSSILNEYTHDTTTATDNPGDDVPMVRWGSDWETEGNDFYAYPAAAAYQGLANNDYDPVTGTINFSATRLGTAAPIGKNGTDYTLLLATVRFQLKVLASPASATFSCKVMQFLDRDGKAVAKAKIDKMAALQVVTEYRLNGSAFYQGAKSHVGIEMECVGPLETWNPITDAKGNFTMGVPDSHLGIYTCTYYGHALDGGVRGSRDDDVFLGGVGIYNFTNHSHQVLPVVMRGGNAFQGGGGSGDEIIDVNDVGEVTLHWDQVVAPYTNGDVNGDALVNEADLAIVGSNYGQTEEQDYSHIIFGLARDYDAKLFPTPNGRIWYGDPLAGSVSELVTSKSLPDFWPTLSPDGRNVALSRYNTKTGHYELYKADMVKLPAKKAILLTPKKGYTRDAFAPSWSPDGQRVAFICSDKDIGSGWEYNEGDVCVVDVNGKNLHQIGSAAKISPPAWYGNTVLIYAGLSSNADCPEDLCFYDFLTGTTGVVDTNLATGSEVADMPSIQDGVLFFRWDNATNTRLRYAPITSYTGGVFALGADLDIPPDTLNVDYYDVSPTLDIIFYRRENNVSSDLFENQDFNGTWAVPVDHYVDGFVGNVSWNGSLNTPTDLHATRATMDWVP
jgi:hypothetical protein